MLRRKRPSAELRISAEAYKLFARLRSGCWGTSHGTSSCATSSPNYPITVVTRWGDSCSGRAVTAFLGSTACTGRAADASAPNPDHGRHRSFAWCRHDGTPYSKCQDCDSGSWTRLSSSAQHSVLSAVDSAHPHSTGCTLRPYSTTSGPIGP